MTTTQPHSSVELLLELFAGRTDVIGLEEGGAWKFQDPTHSDPTKPWLHKFAEHDAHYGADKGPVWWEDHLRNHFNGEGQPVGVYPMVPRPGWSDGQGSTYTGWVVHWGCVDFDEGDHDSLIHARNLVGVLQHFDITAWIEKSRSKGYHVWVFLRDWTPASLVRRALLAGCQIAHAPTKEINPKQETLAEDAVGNYVRLPYPGNNPGEDTGNRMVWTPQNMDYGSSNMYPVERDGWAQTAHRTRVGASSLEPLAELWQPPVLNVSKTFGASTPPPGHRPAERRLSGLAYTMYQGGPLSGSEDRSAWLWSFARELVKSDITSSEAQDFLYAAHDTHAPKWSHRADGGRPQLDRMLAKAAGS